jgi:AcrR family transcriptional regulator
MTTPKVSNEARRKHVVDATLKIISEKGVRNLTTAAIAHEVGMSEANLYRHFANKDEILQVTVGRIAEGLQKNLGKVLEHPGKPIENLRKIFILHLEFVEKNEGIPRLVFSDEIHGGNRELQATILNTINAYSAKLESIIKEGQIAGCIKEDIDPASSALTMIGMIQVTILRWSLSGFSLPLEKEGTMLWNNFEKFISIEC